MNRLKPPTALGLPFHGKVVGGILQTSGGPVTINDLAGGRIGSVAFRVPGAPGVSRNAGQQSLDTAKGYDWQDYILLIGTRRRVSSSRVELGRNKWLYGDANGRAWIMSAAVVNISGAACELRITRGDLFGRFTVGFDYTITDEIVATYSFNAELPTGYSGGSTAAQVAAGLTVDKAAAIWPDPNGSTVHIHILTGRTDIYDAIETATWDGTIQTPERIVTLTLSGTGDPAAGGVGISGGFTNVENYDDRIIVSQESQPLVFSPPYQTGTLCFFTVVDTVPTPPPTGLGQTTTNQSTGFWQKAGFFTEGLSFNSTEKEYKLLRTHSGDVVSRVNEQAASYKSIALGTGSATATANWASVYSEFRDEYFWDGPTSYDNESVSNSSPVTRYQDYTGLFDITVGAITVGVDYRDYSGEYQIVCEPCGDELPGEQVYFDLQIFTTCNQNQITPPENTIDGDAIQYAESAQNLEFTGQIFIWPGIVKIFTRHENATTQSTFDARDVVFGFPENGGTPAVVCDVEDIGNGAKLPQVVGSWGYNPVTGDSDFTLSTLAADAIKYV